MLEAKLTDGNILRKVIDAMKDLIVEANFECSASKISVQAMDTSHVSLVSLELSSKLFEQYRCDRDLVLGLNIVNVAKILKGIQNEDSLAIESKDDGDELAISFESKNGDRISNFNLKLMNLDVEALLITDEPADTIIEMKTDYFNRIIKDLSVIGESVQISTRTGAVNFQCSGSLGSGNISLLETDGQDSQFKIFYTSDVQQKFSLKFLQHFAKAYGIAENVRIHLSSDKPINIEYVIQEDSRLRFYLAPSFSDEEEKE